MNPLWTAVLALGLTGVAAADDELPRTLNDGDREARLLELEARVRMLERGQDDAETIRKLREAAAKEKQQESEELPGRVSKIEKQMASAGQTWDASKMLTFATPDGNFTAKIGGRIYFNYRHIFDRDDGNGGGADTFWLDTARFQLDGSFYKDFIYRVEGEAKSNSGAGAFLTKDVYVGWVLNEAFTLRGGQMKVPFSAEETCSSRFIDFAERSIINRWMPAHDQGFLANGAFADKIFEWTLGVMNTAVSRDAGKGTFDAQDEKMGVGRLFVSPFRNGNNAFKALRLGFDFFLASTDNFSHPDISTGDLGGVNMIDFPAAAAANAIFDGRRLGMLFNLAWAWGPVSLRAEYGQITQDFADGLPESDVTTTMWLAQATWLLTGEAKVIDNRIKPNANFSPLTGGWGAFELAVRAAAFEMGDEVQTAGIGLIGATGNLEAQEFTIGLNWWWSPNVIWRLNYEMLSFDEDLPIGKGNSLEDQQDVFIMRWQIDF